MSLAAVAAGAAARLDPGNDEARTWLEKELSSAVYREHNDPIQRLLDAIERFIDALLRADPSTAGALPSVVAGAVTAVVVAVLLFSLRYVRRDQRRTAADAGVVLGGERLTAARFRERCALALREGRYAAAVVDAMRAIAQSASERTLLDGAPSLTAHEVAVRLSGHFPTRGADLRWAADLFDEVAYGRREPSPEDAERIVAVETALSTARPATSRGSNTPHLPDRGLGATTTAGVIR
jgi:hypothetical protein